MFSLTFRKILRYENSRHVLYCVSYIYVGLHKYMSRERERRKERRQERRKKGRKCDKLLRIDDLR